MEGGLDDLMTVLLEDIALCGEKGRFREQMLILCIFSVMPYALPPFNFDMSQMPF